jgi:hypothetical protein
MAIIEKLKEPSTWRGIVVFLTVFGIKIRPELTDAIVTAGASACAAIEIIRKEKQS